MLMLKRRLLAFKYALEGIAYALRYHPSIFIQLLCGFAAVALGFAVGLSRVEWMILSLTVGAVLAAELLNTAVEVTLDHMTKDHHMRVKHAKDVAAGAVFVISCIAVVVGLLLFIPRFLFLFTVG